MTHCGVLIGVPKENTIFIQKSQWGRLEREKKTFLEMDRNETYECLIDFFVPVSGSFTHNDWSCYVSSQSNTTEIGQWYDREGLLKERKKGRGEKKQSLGVILGGYWVVSYKD